MCFKSGMLIENIEIEHKNVEIIITFKPKFNYNLLKKDEYKLSNKFYKIIEKYGEIVFLNLEIKEQ